MILSWKALRRGVVLAAVVALVSSLMVASVSAQPQLPPNRFYGSVTLDGAQAPAGATVTATIDGNSCADAASVQADGTYVLTVLAAGEGAAGCGTEGATISFAVNGNAAGTATFASGQFTELDLAAVSAAPPTVAPPTVAPPATATPVIITGTGGYLDGGSGTAWWAYAAGGLGLLLLGTAGAAAFRRYAR